MVKGVGKAQQSHSTPHKAGDTTPFVVKVAGQSTAGPQHHQDGLVPPFVVKGVGKVSFYKQFNIIGHSEELATKNLCWLK